MRRGSKKRTKRAREQILRSPEWIAKHKEMFLKAMAIGHAPTRAAKLAKVGRSTVYEWRGLDAEFAKAWEDAVEQGLDLVEDRLMRRAITENDARLANNRQI